MMIEDMMAVDLVRKDCRDRLIVDMIKKVQNSISIVNSTRETSQPLSVHGECNHQRKMDHAQRRVDILGQGPI